MNFWDINVKAQISTALVLIVILLMYIAYKISDNKKVASKSKR